MRNLLLVGALLVLAVSPAAAANFTYTGFSFNLFGSTGGAFNPTTGNMWFHDHGAATIYEVTTAGVQTGNVINMPGDPDMHGLAYNPNTGNFWASESGGQLVIEFNSAGAQVSSFPAATADQTGLTLNPFTNNLYWTSWTHGSINEYAPGGAQVGNFGSTSNPLSLEYLSHSNTILVSNSNGATLEELDLSGAVIGSWDMGGLVGTSVRIRAMAWDSNNCNLYIANELDGRVYELHDTGCSPTPVEASTWGHIKSLF